MTTLYTKPNCVQCNAVKRALEREGLDFETVDVSADTEAFEMIYELGYRQVPVVMSGDIHFSGFRPDMIAEIVAAQSGYRPA